MEIGTVVTSLVGPNRDGLIPVRLCTCTVTGLTDTRTVQLLGPLDHSPVPGTKLFILPAEDSWEFGIEIEEVAAMLALVIGEKVMSAYTEPGVPSPTARIRLNPITGTVGLCDGVGTAVEFARLKAAFNQLKSDHDTHVHVVSGSADLGTGTVTGTAQKVVVGSTANIDPAESPLVNLP